MSDRIWAIFTAPDIPTIEQQIDEVLGLVRHWPEPQPHPMLHALCGETLGTADDWPCRLPAGHDGHHENQHWTWGER